MSKPELTYLPLAPYKGRYTELSSVVNGWFHEAFSKSFCAKILLPNTNGSQEIRNGEVLDAHHRCEWAMQQMAMLLATDDGVTEAPIYLDDFFHPGLESLAYCGIHKRRPVYSFCWAQTFDQYDFTRKRMFQWMRKYEEMACEIYATIFVASPLLRDFILTSMPNLSPEKVVVVGLPFSSKHARNVRGKAVAAEPYDVVYSSRLDSEKNPRVFADYVDLNAATERPLRVVLCSGHEELRGDDTNALERLRKQAEDGKLTILLGLDKQDYYAVLASSRCQLNTGSQDWVSYTLLESLTFGCIPVYPRHRDFVDVFKEIPHHLYIPGDAQNALDITSFMVTEAARECHAGLNKLLRTHDGALDRICDTILTDVQTLSQLK